MTMTCAYCTKPATIVEESGALTEAVCDDHAMDGCTCPEFQNDWGIEPVCKLHGN